MHCINRIHSWSSYWLASSIKIKSIRRNADGGDHLTFESAPGRLYCNTPCMVLISMFSIPSMSGSIDFKAWTSWPVGHTINTLMYFLAAETAASSSNAVLPLPGAPAIYNERWLARFRSSSSYEIPSSILSSASCCSVDHFLF